MLYSDVKGFSIALIVTLPRLFVLLGVSLRSKDNVKVVEATILNFFLVSNCLAA